MTVDADNSNAIVRPPIAWALVAIAGFGLDKFYPWPIMPPALPKEWFGAALFAIGLALAIWAIVTMLRAGTHIQTTSPTTRLVAAGPYRFTRNPIYIGMFLGQLGLACGFDSLWLLVALLPFYLVIRYDVIGCEEAYLERKFGSDYLGYRSRVRRWL